MIRAILVLLIALLGGLGLWLKPAPVWEFAPQARATLGTGETFETVFSYETVAGTSHAPAIVDGDDNTQKLIWFEGTRESHPDVKILSSNLGANTTEDLMTRQDLSASFIPRQTILTLGNALGDVTGQSHFVTVVTLGGWAAASVAHVREGAVRKLNLSPIIARSHLIKSPVIEMKGGAVMVPAYFELSKGYGVAALLDEKRRVVGQSSMRGGFAGIQPVVVPLSGKKAVALLRRFDKANDRLLASWTEDGGESWSALAPLALPNPNAPVAAVPLDNGDILMLYNDHAQKSDTLRFATSSDMGATWVPRRLLDGPDKGNLRYPMMKVLANGRIMATYSTMGKKGIVAHVFSADWAVQP